LRKIKLIVVEDEPAAMDHICTLVENFCTLFSIIDKCGNGTEALDKIERHKPELLLTDIKMPVMNGIDLIAEIRERFPSIKTILMSGFQDFQYAKIAIHQGVVEYILKPLSVKSVSSALQKAAEIIHKEWQRQQACLVKRMANNMHCSDKEITDCFPECPYYLGIIRKNGLIRRFQGNNVKEPAEIEYIEKSYYGRDDNEIIYILPTEQMSFSAFDEKFRGFENDAEEGFFTTVLLRESCEAADLPNRIKYLVRNLDRSIIIGTNQNLCIGNDADTKEEDEVSIEAYNHVVKGFEYLATIGDPVLIKKQLREFIDSLEKHRRSQIWVEAIIKWIFLLLLRRTKAMVSNVELENMLEEAFLFSDSYGELYNNLDLIVDRLHADEAEGNCKIDSKEFFDQILVFVDKNIGGQIYLQSVCDTFHVSQPYISRLFKKYTGSSFSKYLNSMRIKEAVRLMETDETIHIKEISDALGFSDQFYFSKVFKIMMKCTPSEYLKKLKHESEDFIFIQKS